MESTDIKIVKKTKTIKPEKKVTIKDLIESFGGDETFTKRRYRSRSKYPRDPQNTLADNVRLEANASLMIDILELPTASFGFHYCLVCCDISGNGHFDIEK